MVPHYNIMISLSFTFLQHSHIETMLTGDVAVKHVHLGCFCTFVGLNTATGNDDFRITVSNVWKQCERQLSPEASLALTE